MIINVAIVEDNSQIREGLKSMVESSDELFCCGIFPDAESFFAAFKTLNVDVVLMDIKLPGKSGIEAVSQLSKIKGKEHVNFLMCTDFDDKDKVWNAIRLGATGYLLKNISSDNLIKSIKEVFEGGSPMSPEIARKVLRFFKDDQLKEEELNTLTEKEREIMELFAKGYPAKYVADHLSISVNTVAVHCRNIHKKLHVHNRTEALNKLFPKASL